MLRRRPISAQHVWQYVQTAAANEKRDNAQCFRIHSGISSVVTVRDLRKRISRAAQAIQKRIAMLNIPENCTDLCALYSTSTQIRMSTRTGPLVWARDSPEQIAVASLACFADDASSSLRMNTYPTSISRA